MDLLILPAWLYQLDLSLKVAIGLIIAFIIYSIQKTNSIDTSPNGLLAWKKQRELRLYNLTRLQAVALEAMIILLGIFTAINSDKTITLTSIFVIVIALTEYTKLVVTEAASRFPSIGMVILCFFALLISAGFSGDTLFRISTSVTDEAIGEVSAKQNAIKENAGEIIDIQKELENYQQQKIKLDESMKDSSLVKLHQDEIRLILENVANLQDEKSELIKDNNAQEKTNIKQRLLDVEAYIKKLDDDIYKYKSIYQENLELLRSAKFQEVDNARRGYIKSNIRALYDIKIRDLSEKNVSDLEILTNERKRLIALIDKENLRLNELIPLNEDTVRLVSNIEAKIQQQNTKVDELRRINKEFVTDNTSAQESLSIKINQEEQQISVLTRRNTDLSAEITDLKTNNTFYSMAGLFFQKEASDISEPELKEFLKYFVAIAAVGLAVMPVLLFSISIQIEKRITDEAKDITFRQFLLQILNSIKLSLKYFSNGAQSSFEYLKEKRNQKFEENSKIELEKEKRKAIEIASSHVKINEDMSGLRKYFVSEIKKIWGSLEYSDTSQRQAMLESVIPEIEKMISEKVAQKELNATHTQNYISRSFLQELVNKNGDKNEDK